MTTKGITQKFTATQKTLLGMAFAFGLFHYYLKTDDAKEALDLAYKWVRMINLILVWLCFGVSGWEGWRAKQQVQEGIQNKLKDYEKTDTLD